MIVALGLWFTQSAHALSLDGLNFVQYGDGQSYSLPISALTTGCTHPGCPYVIKSGPGQIDQFIVVATGTNNMNAVTNFPGMDNAYPTPNSSGNPFFSTPTVADPGGINEFTRDNANTWDSTLAALKTFLAGDRMVFFFNNNQTDSGGATNQNLAAWVQFTITNNVGTVIGTYDFTNMGGNYALFTEGGGGNFNGNVGSYTSTGAGPTGDSSGSPTDYVLSGGPICLTALNIPVSCSNAAATQGPINHNLGADRAAYAITFPELDTQLAGLFGSVSDANLANYTLHIDLRLGCDPALFTTSPACLAKSLNNGFEQLFIARLESFVSVPEPMSLILFGSGLLALVGWKRRQR